MVKKLTAFTLILVLSGIAGAATYDWDGSAGNGNWYTPANWTVTGSSYTYPNDQRNDYHTNDDAQYINIIDGGEVQAFDDIYLCVDSYSSFAYLTVDNSTLSAQRFYLADRVQSTDSRLYLENGAVLNVSGFFKLDDGTAELHVTDSTVNVTYDNTTDYGYVSVADNGTAVMYTDNADINMASDLYIARYTGSDGAMHIDNASVIDVGRSMYVGYDGGGELYVSDSTVTTDEYLVIRNWDDVDNCYMEVNGNSTINVGSYLLLNHSEDSATSPTSNTAELVLNSGSITVGYGCYFNSSIGPYATAIVRLNGGILHSEGPGAIYVNYHRAGEAYLTANTGSTVIADGTLYFGSTSVGSDTGIGRVYVAGGTVQAEDLRFNMTDAKVVFTDGELRIRTTALSESEMQDLIDDGRIDISDAPCYRISTSGVYTVLLPAIKGDFVPACGDVDLTDFAYFASHWLESGCHSGNNYCSGADLNRLGDVGLSDLSIFCQNWLQ